MTALFRKKPKPFPSRGGPQGLRRPRFSFFRFTCQTARKPCGFHPHGSPDWRTKRPTKFEPPTTFRRSCPHISEELQRRVFTPLADGAPYDRAYMCHPGSVSTTKHKLSRRSNSARIQRLSHSLRVPAPRLLAALEPHSSAVLAPVKDQGTSEGT
jgi:hypothetical protein